MAKEPKPNLSNDSPKPALTIEQLQDKYEKLHRKKIEAETHYKVTLADLEKMKTQARATWGTDDIEALKQKLVQMQQENEQRRADYQKSLESIEAKLLEIENKYRDADSHPS